MRIFAKTRVGKLYHIVQPFTLLAHCDSRHTVDRTTMVSSDTPPGTLCKHCKIIISVEMSQTQRIIDESHCTLISSKFLHEAEDRARGLKLHKYEWSWIPWHDPDRSKIVTEILSVGQKPYNLIGFFTTEERFDICDQYKPKCFGSWGLDIHHPMLHSGCCVKCSFIKSCGGKIQ